MTAYYNEHDNHAAGWLEALISAGRIARGVVDRRSIVDVRPSDLQGFVQCHFFAGIGIWSAALREAGWPDERPVWTASCPCQPLSGAGKRKGHVDERHLWPALYRLIPECRPATILGEQVASPDGQEWLSAVRADLEAVGYAIGAADLCAAGACVDFGESAEGAATLEWIRGALLHCPDPILAAELRDYAAWAGAALGYGPAHIRQRLYWVADAADSGYRRQRNGATGIGEPFGRNTTRPLADADGGDASAARLQRSGQHGQQQEDGDAGAWSGAAQSLALPDQGQRGRIADSEGRQPYREAAGRQQGDGEPQSSGDVGELGNSGGAGLAVGPIAENGRGSLRLERPAATASGAQDRCADWILCTDGKARPTQPGILPLAHDWRGSSRVACLRAAGNAINKAVAVAFVKAVQGVMSGT